MSNLAAFPAQSTVPLTIDHPGHKGVEGNKRADDQAKKAVMEGSSDTNSLLKFLKKRLPHSKSAVIQVHGGRLKKRAQKLWQTSPRYNRMKKTDPKTPSTKYIDLVTPLPRKLASVLSAENGAYTTS
jgi:hypothetical protein